jgi:hypothetical protein
LSVSILHFLGAGISISEVIRDSRNKESSPGVPFTEIEHCQYQAQVIACLKAPREETAAQKKRRLNKVSFSLPRHTTLVWLRALEHGMSWATGKQFKDFDMKDLLACSPEDGSDVVPYPLEAFGRTHGCPPVLVMTSDQHSVQSAGVSYLKYHLKLNVEHLPDPHHISWNDTMEACSKSGYHGALHASVIIFNLAYGPFQHSAFFNDLKDAASDISASVGPNDALLLHFWDGICKDHGWLLDEDCGEIARARYLQELPMTESASFKGPKAALSRWYSFLHAFNFWRTSWHTKLFLITFISIRKGWARSIDDILTPPRKEQALAAAALLLLMPPSLTCSSALSWRQVYFISCVALP